MQKNLLLNQYLSEEDTKVKKAEPKVSDYREKFRKKALSLNDLPVIRPAPFAKRSEDNLGGLLLGEGIEREF